MVSLFSTSIGSSATANESRRAFYLAEAGLRYGLSELRQKGFSTSNITTLNTTEYKMPPSGNFDITVFGAWFKSPSNQSVASGALSVEIDKGKIPPSFFEKTLTVPAFIANLYLVVASLDPGSSTQKPNPAEVAKVNGFSHTVGNDTSFTFDLNDNLVVGKDKHICMAFKPLDGTFTPGNSSSYLDLNSAAANIFPKADGSFQIGGQTYFYKTAKEEGGAFRIRGITPGSGVSSNPVTVAGSTDYILLSPNNYFVTSKGTSSSGQVTFGGDLDNAVSLADHSYHSEPDIALDITKVAQRESDESFITGGTENSIPYLQLSGSTGFGAAWYNQNLSLGGLGGLNGPTDYYCSSGACLLKRGLRAFFTLEFSSIDGSPSGDGLIFALLNGASNSIASIGGDYERSELLGYSGDGRLPPPGISYPPSSSPGLFPPKMGLEFDTKVNLSDAFENKPVNFCDSLTSLKTNTRNDPNSDGRDSIQYVFWGNNSLTDACRDNLPSYDDNRHSAEGPLTPNWNISIGMIESSPAIAPDGTIYIGTMNGFVHAFNSDGTRKISWSTPFNTGTGAAVSTPVIVGESSNYTIYAASGNKLFAIDPDKNEKSNFPVTVSGTITGKPVVGSGSDKTIYLTTSENIFKFGGIYAITPNGNLKPEWASNPVILINPTTPPVITPPAISNNNSRLYVALRNNSGSLYSLRTSDGTTAQQRPLGAKIDNAVGVGPGSVPEGIVYVATNNKLVYALYGDNLLSAPKWTTTAILPGEEYSSSPVASPDGNTVYVGNYDDNLYAINAASGNLRWHYPAAGNVQSIPFVDSSNIVYFGSDIRSSDDKRNVYALYGVDGTEKWRFETNGDVRGTPAVRPDGAVYVGSFDFNFYCINQFANPKGFRNLRVTSNSSNSIVGRDIYNSISQQLNVILDSGNEYHWLKGAPSQNKKLWAVRIEVTRNPITVEVPGEYTLKTWIRQCNNNTDCDNIYDTFYEDTRVNYPTDTKPPLLTQTIQLSTGDHNWFNSFLFGFTSARDAADDQFATIRNFQLSFIRPNDPIAERNPLIPISDPDPNLP